MKIKYDFKFYDLLAFTTWHQFYNPVMQICFTGLPILWVHDMGNFRVVELITIAIIFYGIILDIHYAFNALYLLSRNNKNLLTTHEIEVADEAFIEETEFSKTISCWPGVVRAVSRPGYVAVYLTANSAHAIPDRAFPSEKDRNLFLKTVQEKITAAKRK